MSTRRWPRALTARWAKPCLPHLRPARLTIAVLALILLGGLALRGPAPASFAQTATNAAVSNVTHKSFTVSWTTDEPCQGSVRWGKSGEDLSNVARESRNQNYEGKTHYAVVTGLEPSTTYRFELLSGASVSTTQYSTTTAPVIQGTNQPINLFGHVYSRGNTPASEAVVLVRLVDRDGIDTSGRSQWLSTTIDPSNGEWTIPIGSVLTEQRDKFFHFSLQGDDVQVIVYTGTAELQRTVDTQVNSISNATPIDIWEQTSGSGQTTPTTSPFTPTPTTEGQEAAYPPPESSPTPEPPTAAPQSPPSPTAVPPTSESAATQPSGAESGYPAPDNPPAPFPTDTPTPGPVQTTGPEGSQPSPTTASIPPAPSPTSLLEGQPALTQESGSGAQPTELSPVRITATALAGEERFASRASPTPSPSILPAVGGQVPASAQSRPTASPGAGSSSLGMLTLAAITLTLLSSLVLGSLWYQAKKSGRS